MLEELKENQRNYRIVSERESTDKAEFNQYIYPELSTRTNRQLKLHILPEKQSLKWQVQPFFLDLIQVDSLPNLTMMPTSHLPAYNSALGMPFFSGLSVDSVVVLVQILTLPLTGCMTLGTLANLSKPQICQR